MTAKTKPSPPIRAHVGRSSAAPRPTPESEHECSDRDPQPRDAERRHACEQEHGEGGPEVVEHRADDEVRVRRNRFPGRGMPSSAHTENCPRALPVSTEKSTVFSAKIAWNNGVFVAQASDLRELDQPTSRSSAS
jgi:hypothetical protein